MYLLPGNLNSTIYWASSHKTKISPDIPSHDVFEWKYLAAK